MKIRIVSLNIGAALKVPPAGPLPPLDNLTGLSSFLQRLAGDADNMVVGLQEVDNCLDRSRGIHQARYFDDMMGSGWVHIFQKRLTAQGEGALKKYDGPSVPPAFQDYIFDCDNAGFGNAVLSNVAITKTQYWTFAWDPDNPIEYGRAPMGAIAAKLKVGGQRLWFINTHLSTCIIAAERQIWQLLGNIGRFDPTTPIIMIGDLNIRKDGYHTINGVDEDHKRVYERMTKILKAAGFVQIGENDGFTFKPWNDYSKIDYVFVLDPDKIGQTFANMTFELANPAALTDRNRIYTDHKALIADLEWR